MATRQCRFVLDNNAIAINTPINPGPEPPGVVDAREWRELYQTFWVEQKKFYASFDTAIGILQSMLIYQWKMSGNMLKYTRMKPEGGHKMPNSCYYAYKHLYQDQYIT
ncbi:MAG: hypothetical protein ACK53Y_14355, partial [bacterium]